MYLAGKLVMKGIIATRKTGKSLPADPVCFDAVEAALLPPELEHPTNANTIDNAAILFKIFFINTLLLYKP